MRYGKVLHRVADGWVHEVRAFGEHGFLFSTRTFMHSETVKESIREADELIESLKELEDD